MANPALLNVIAVLILVQQIVAFMLKRDKQEKHIIPLLLAPPLLILYLIVWPAVQEGRAMQLSSFSTQVAGLQVAAIVLALASKMEGQAGQAGFWLASVINLISVGYILFGL